MTFSVFSHAGSSVSMYGNDSLLFGRFTTLFQPEISQQVLDLFTLNFGDSHGV